MQNSSWIALLRLIPASLHNQLALTTTIGIDIAIQNVFRLEEEYLVVRGRLSGTMDAGRIFLVPYDQINFIGLQKLLKQPDVEAIFKGTYDASAPAETTEAVEVEAPAESAAAEPPQPEVSPAAPVAAPAREPKKPPSRQLLLERVRARLAAANKGK
jgi:hypothetical protein